MRPNGNALFVRTEVLSAIRKLQQPLSCETSVLPVIRPERKLAPLLVYRAQRTPFAGQVEHL